MNSQIYVRCVIFQYIATHTHKHVTLHTEVCSYSDEDMQSVASLMSIGKTDIGIMEDVEEEEEEGTSKDFSARLSEITSELSKLDSHADGNPFGNPFEDDLDLECDDGFCGIVCLALLFISFLKLISFMIFTILHF